MADYESFKIGPKKKGNKGNLDAVKEDVARISEVVNEYMPDFTEPGVHRSEEYDQEKPFAVTGAWHDNGEIYIMNPSKQNEEFPKNMDSIHETGHAVGEYIRQTLMPSSTVIFNALENKELKQLNNLSVQEEEKLDEYLEIREELISGHFAAGFEHALRNEMGLSTDNIEGEKKYADAEDGCEDVDRDYFWEEEDEASLSQFLYTAVQRAETQREEFFELLPDDKIDQIDYSNASEVFR